MGGGQGCDGGYNVVIGDPPTSEILLIAILFQSVAIERRRREVMDRHIVANDFQRLNKIVSVLALFHSYQFLIN